MKSIIKDALFLIETIECEKLPVRVLIARYSALFSETDCHSLIPPECRECDRYSETAYVYVIGSYLYQHITGNSVTWFERRRFAEYDRYFMLFSKSLSSNPKRRFQQLYDLKEYLTRMMTDENTN